MLLKIYYSLKPFIPRRVQLSLRRIIAKRKLQKIKESWPICPGSEKIPKYFKAWPEGRFALALTHDVDTQRGHDRVKELMKLEMELGFRSSFNFVPERYNVSIDLIDELKANSFEIGVHGLVHDGRLYESKEIFLKRAKKINFYLKEWNAVGFRSPAMHHNLDWIHDLDILYDSSTFDTDPFEPQNDGVNTIFPFWVENPRNPSSGYVEMPYTLPQDHNLFIILQMKDISIWKKKLDWIVENGGMALLNCHPDYMYFGHGERSIEDYSASLYEDFLRFVKAKYSHCMWHPLPREMANFWKSIASGD